MKSKTLPAWARLVCTAAAALVFLLVYEWAVYGVPLGKIYLPASAWSDEVYYAKQLSAVVTHGVPQGYFGFNKLWPLHYKENFRTGSKVLKNN